jgi:hypothetical protein
MKGDFKIFTVCRSSGKGKSQRQCDIEVLEDGIQGGYFVKEFDTMKSSF